MEKITIIGSESFISQNLIRYLNVYHKGEFEFFCYDYISENDSKSPNYKQIDFSKDEDVSKINFNVDSVLIFTGKTGTVNGFLNFESFVVVNEVFLLRILNEYVKQCSKAKLFYPSSRLIYKSNNYNLINENSERELKSIYAVTKQNAENYLKLYNHAFGLDYVILRICTPFGSIIDSDGNYGTFEIFRKQAKEKGFVTIFGDGNDRKTYTNIVDVCEAFYILMTAKKMKYRDYNLGGYAFSMNEAVSLIVKDLNVEVFHAPWPKDYLKVDGGTVVFDSSRFDNEFNMIYHTINFIKEKKE